MILGWNIGEISGEKTGESPLKLFHHSPVNHTTHYYRFPGRIGSSAAYNSESGHVLLCGGLDSSGPPISTFKDCQVLDLDKR